MSGEFVLNAEKRRDVGKGASRRLRREQAKLPAIVYGGNKAPENITLPLKEVTKALENEGFYSHVISLAIEGSSEPVVLKALQRHPAKNSVTHIDFMRVVAGQTMTMHTPLHFINADKAPGVKLQGGIVTHQATEIEIRCLPSDIPEFIEVDMGAMNVGDTLHISNLKLPKGVESVALAHDHDLALAAIIAPRVDKGEGTAAAAEGGESKE